MTSVRLLVATLLAAQQPADIRVDVNLVTVACSVSDKQGLSVRGLKKDDFRLEDNGEYREIRDLWQEADLPLTVALVADVSGSQRSLIKNHREAVDQFFRQVIGARDQAMVVEVAQQAWLISDLTSSAADLQAAIEKIGAKGPKPPVLGPLCRNKGFPKSCGGTALWHALYYTAEKMSPVVGRKAIVVLSDGMDTGSDVDLPQLTKMAQSAEVSIYSIKYPNPARYFSITAAIGQAVSHGMERLARDTGGLNFSNPGRDTAEVFSKIEADLRNIYVLAISPPRNAQDGTFHKLKMSTNSPDLTVRYRSGYWSQNAINGK